MRYLNSRGLIRGWDILDYGCGRGFDAKQFSMDKYDPYFFPDKPKKMYDLIVCHFVLNVVEEQEAKEILLDIKSMLVLGGCAYITVRRDVKKEGYTSKGTYQRNVVLNLPVLHQTANYCIYLLDRESSI